MNKKTFLIGLLSLGGAIGCGMQSASAQGDAAAPAAPVLDARETKLVKLKLPGMV